MRPVTMRTVGVRSLKAQLSGYLKVVASGTRLIVTDRGRPVAVLGPADAPENPAWARRMVTEGHARWAGGKPLGLRRRSKQTGVLASRMVLDDRR